MTTHDEIEGPKTTERKANGLARRPHPHDAVPRATPIPRSGYRTQRMTRLARKLRNSGSAARPTGIKVETHDQLAPICERTQRETDELGQPDPRK